MTGRWGAAGPPAEAYGRLTDVARFAELHDVGRNLLDDLERRYDARRVMTTEPDSHSAVEAAAVTLVPADPLAATLTLVFDAFPGLIMRFGDCGSTHEPICGCDACDEDLDSCVERLTDLVEAVVAGAFGERLVYDDAWWYESWHRTAGTDSRGRSLVEGARLDELRAALPIAEREWRPWPVRQAEPQSHG